MAAMLVGLPLGGADVNRWARTWNRDRSPLPVRMPTIAAIPRNKNVGKKKDNAWKQALQDDAKRKQGSGDFRRGRPQPKPKQESKAKKKDVSVMFLLDQEEVLQEEEIVPAPAWTTFSSNSRGVWRGVGAVFSPDTAAVEPVGLGKRNEYLYDCRIVSFVESVADRRSLDREVLWNLHNPYASKAQEQVRLQDEAIAQDLAEEEAAAAAAGNPETDTDGEESLVESGETSVSEVVESGADGGAVDAEGRRAEDADEDFDDDEQEYDGNEDDDDFEYVTEEDLDDEDEDDEEFGDYVSEDEDGVTDAEEDTEGNDGDTDATAPEEAVEVFPLPDLKPKHSYEGMKDVMEKERIDMEPGLVFFEDGAFSRGPRRLLRPKDDTSVARGYFYSPTHRIEQCLVRAGHKRVRICHTVSVNDETDEVEVLRVSAYEEEWIGPVNDESFRTSNNPELQLLSQRSRFYPKTLVGTWKVFEISSSISPEQGDGVFTCKELRRRRRMPAAGGEQEPTILWLPGNIYTYVDLTESGVLRIGAGWRLDEKTNLVIERDYDPDGLLLEVRVQTEILLSKSTRK